MNSSKKPKESAKPEYHLEFSETAKKEWGKLDNQLKIQFARKLKERLGQPCVEADKLRGMPGCYKIKLRSAGYRLVYQVQQERVVVLVVAVGRRDKSAVYKQSAGRLDA